MYILCLRAFTQKLLIGIVVPMKKEYQVAIPEDFKNVIEDIFDWHKESSLGNLVIALHGDLGAGKTAFVQELGKYLDVEETITSPTFTLMKQYELENQYFEMLVHIDAYRFESEAEAGPLRLSEIFDTSNIIVCLEWPEQIPSIVPSSAVQISIGIGLDDVRQVTVTTKSDK